MTAGIISNYRDYWATFGACCAGYISIKLILHIFRAIKAFFLAPLLNLGVNPKTLGDWGVVTGATDGIGKAYATALAKKGVNVVLISRTASKLTETASYIKEIAGVETKCIVADFSEGTEIYSAIETQLKGLDVGILINNVGMSYEYPEYLHEVPDRDSTFQKLLHINVFSVTFMTTMLLPQMAEKRKGAIVNVGSASCFGFPLLTVYAATKAYVDSFSQNLMYEYSDKGIVIQSVIPMFVATKMSRMKRSYFVPSPEEYVKSAVETIGIESQTLGYFSHWLNFSLLRALPQAFVMKLFVRLASRSRAYMAKKMKLRNKSK